MIIEIKHSLQIKIKYQINYLEDKVEGFFRETSAKVKKT